MSPILLVLAVIAALTIGLALGWTFAARPTADLKQRLAQSEAATKDLDDKFRRAITELATASTRAEQAQTLAQHLDAARAETTRLAAQVATLTANATHAEQQKRLLLEAQETLKKEFEVAGHRVLASAQETFLTRAQARFTETEKTNAERIHAVLAPVEAQLKRYETQVTQLEAKRADAFSLLHGQINELRTGQEQVRAEAARLGHSLRNAPKARGRWGEQQLKNVLEQCGLAEHTDFETEHSVTTEDGRLRPDAIVRIPGNKLLVIDAKVSLNAYQDAFEADDEPLRKLKMAAHAAAMKAHVTTLGAKSYQSQFENAADYVVMFVPGEHFIAAALEQDPTLWDYAFERRVLLASPTNLVAIARTIAQVWQQEGLAKEAREIGKIASDLYDSLAKTQDDLAKTGIHLGRAVNSFNDFARTYEGNVLSRARRLSEKHIKIGKREIVEDVPVVESAPRHADTALLLNEAE